MDSALNEIFQMQNLEECIIDYYPHIIMQYDTGGIFQNETFTSLNVPNAHESCDTVTEYVHREKKLIIHESGDREYLSIQQKMHKLSDGLFVVSKVDCIDPNKFPILCKYYDICNKKIKSYDDKYITTSIISESISKNNINYIKMSFTITPTIIRDDVIKRKIIKRFKEVVSLLPRKESP